MAWQAKLLPAVVQASQMGAGLKAVKAGPGPGVLTRYGGPGGRACALPAQVWLLWPSGD